MRLIDADAFIEELEADAEHIESSIARMMHYAIIKDIEHAPSIDAVELRDVAKMLCDTFGDSCACNYNGIDEWLPYVCKYEKSGECPSPNDEHGCWMEFLRNKFGGE